MNVAPTSDKHMDAKETRTADRRAQEMQASGAPTWSHFRFPIRRRTYHTLQQATSNNKMAPRSALSRLFGALALIACATTTATAQATATNNANATATAAPGVLGGWKTVPVTDRESALLERALSNVSSYRSSVTARVCVREIKSLTQQVVAGTNYRFVVDACSVAGNGDKSVGMCASKSNSASGCSEYAIRVFEQTWTNTLEVTAIESSSSSGTTSPSTDTPASSSPNGTTTTSVPTTTASPSGSSNNSSKNSATDAKTPAATTTAPKDSAASSCTRSVVALGALFVLASVVVA